MTIRLYVVAARFGGHWQYALGPQEYRDTRVTTSWLPTGWVASKDGAARMTSLVAGRMAKAIQGELDFCNSVQLIAV